MWEGWAKSGDVYYLRMIKIVIINPDAAFKSPRIPAFGTCEDDVYKKLPFPLSWCTCYKKPIWKSKNFNLQLNILKSKIMGATSTNWVMYFHPKVSKVFICVCQNTNKMYSLWQFSLSLRTLELNISKCLFCMWNEIQHFTACTRFQFSFWMKKRKCCHHLLTLMPFQTCLTFLLPIKWKSKTMDPVDFYCMYKQNWHSSNYFK